MELISRIGILLFFSLVINGISYIICDIIGYRIHGEENGDRNSALYIAIKVAAGNGNAISLPILVMQILCQDQLINADYDHDSEKCYDDATSMIFVYMISWFVMFWGYGFPTLESLKHFENRNSLITTLRSRHNSTASEVASNLFQYYKKAILDTDNQQYVIDKIKKIFINPAILSVIIALIVGLIKPIQEQLFTPEGHLSIIGASLETVGDPVVALNCLIMAAS